MIAQPNDTSRRWPVVYGGWLSVGFGLAALLAYASTPGPAGETRLAGESPLGCRERPAAWRLVVGVHPHCPCTLATVANLKRLDPLLRDRVAVHAFVYTPARVPEEWRNTHVYRALRSAEGVSITLDTDGAMSAWHGIETSGGVVLYDPTGAPRFHGGITPSRGHEGPCAGVEAIRAIVIGRRPALNATPIFGCRIDGEEPDGS